MNSNKTKQLSRQITDAYAEKRALVITGGGSKTFYGNEVEGETLSTAGHSGIIEYQPSELVVTVRSGTLLSELEAELKANNQMLAFEPPQYSAGSTIGGAVACGLSGPGRVAYGSARDFVLGTTIINGKGEKLKFGGQVMKNVAGYDAARLMVGAQGTLGLLLDISLKVLPVKACETTIAIKTDLQTAGSQLRQWVKQGEPVTASCYLHDTLYLRLGSTASAVRETLKKINQQFTTEEIDEKFWVTIKNQSHSFFKDEFFNETSSRSANTGTKTLWRCSHQSTTEVYGDSANQLIEWNGALRWQYSDKDLHTIAASHGGHATRYPLNSEQTQPDIFQPLPAAMLKLQQRLKQAFDPENILNPGRLYTGL